MRRPVSATRRTSGDSATIVVRAGERDLGAITQLGSDEADTLSGNFVNRPAYTDFAETFVGLARALQAGDGDAVAAARAALKAADIQVWHTVHEMQIDDPGTLTISGGRARFRPNGAFLMMRTGGL
ncbi:MAG: hypothetical protein R3D68_02385 [Hyphomicrobiaceae bacterium]